MPGPKPDDLFEGSPDFGDLGVPNSARPFIIQLLSENNRRVAELRQAMQEQGKLQQQLQDEVRELVALRKFLEELMKTIPSSDLAQRVDRLETKLAVSVAAGFVLWAVIGWFLKDTYETIREDHDRIVRLEQRVLVSKSREQSISSQGE